MEWVFSSLYCFYAPPDVSSAMLDIYPKILSFQGLEEGQNPASKWLIIENIGTGPMEWTVEPNSPSEEIPSWLIIYPSNGVIYDPNIEYVSISPNLTGLSAGRYDGRFKISAPAAANSPQTVRVQLDVRGPELYVPLQNFSFSSYQNSENPQPQTLSIVNLGGGTLNWILADANDLPPSLPSWLIVSSLSGSIGPGESQSVLLEVDTADLPNGQYGYFFKVISTGAQNSPQTVSVDLRVVGAILKVDLNSDYCQIQEFNDFEQGFGNWENVSGYERNFYWTHSQSWGANSGSKTGPSSGAEGSIGFVFMDIDTNWYPHMHALTAILEGPEISGRNRLLKF